MAWAGWKGIGEAFERQGKWKLALAIWENAVKLSLGEERKAWAKRAEEARKHLKAEGRA
jgi:hypothetical protein